MNARAGCRLTRGQLVRDESTGRIGMLMYMGDWEDPCTRTTQRLAFLRPEHGGREWTTPPHRVTVLPPAAKGVVGDEKPCDHAQIEKRGGKIYCKKCKQQLYL